MNLYLSLRATWLALALLVITSCNNSSSSPTETSNQEATPEPTAEAPMPVKKAETAPPPSIDCASLLTPAMIEDACKASGIQERITSVERKGSNCNRSYGMKNAWGDELIFIVSPKNDAAGAASAMGYMKKDNAENGLKAISGIGDGAIALSFKDKLSGRQQEQLIFHKNNLLIELKAVESRSAKTPCPCYNASQLQTLAKLIAEKIQ
jgi:hypothetical protein